MGVKRRNLVAGDQSPCRQQEHNAENRRDQVTGATTAHHGKGERRRRYAASGKQPNNAPFDRLVKTVDDTPNRLSGRREKEIRSDSRCWGNAEQHDQDWGQQRSAANASRANEGTNEETDDRVVRIDRSKQHDRLLANPPPFDRQSRDLMADHRYHRRFSSPLTVASSSLSHSSTNARLGHGPPVADPTYLRLGLPLLEPGCFTPQEMG